MVLSEGPKPVHTSCSSDLDVKSIDAQLLAPNRNILSRQHGRIRRRLVTIRLYLHPTGETGQGFAATGITQNVSL